MFGSLDRPRRVALADSAGAKDHGLGRALRHEERLFTLALHHHAQEPPREVVGELGELAIRREVWRLRAPDRRAASKGLEKPIWKWLLR